MSNNKMYKMKVPYDIDNSPIKLKTEKIPVFKYPYIPVVHKPIGYVTCEERIIANPFGCNYMDQTYMMFKYEFYEKEYICIVGRLRSKSKIKINKFLGEIISIELKC